MVGGGWPVGGEQYNVTSAPSNAQESTGWDRKVWPRSGIIHIFTHHLEDYKRLLIIIQDIEGIEYVFVLVVICDQATF